MKIEKIIQVGLISAFSITSLCLSSCDGGSGSQEEFLPSTLRAGEVIIINGNDGPTLTIQSGSNLTFDAGYGLVDASYRFYRSGDRNVIDLRFDTLLVEGQAISALNQSIADPSSNLNNLIFSGNPTNAELNFFLRAVQDSNIDMALEHDENFNLFIQDSYVLDMPRSGDGTVIRDLSGMGIKLILGSGGRLVAVQSDNQIRGVKYEFNRNAGVTYTVATVTQ
jgi:hypothetical protein